MARLVRQHPLPLAPPPAARTWGSCRRVRGSSGCRSGHRSHTKARGQRSPARESLASRPRGPACATGLGSVRPRSSLASAAAVIIPSTSMPVWTPRSSSPAMIRQLSEISGTPRHGRPPSATSMVRSTTGLSLSAVLVSHAWCARGSWSWVWCSWWRSGSSSEAETGGVGRVTGTVWYGH